MVELFLREEVYAVIGAAVEVHKELGPGFLEAVYQEAMEIELEMRGLPFESQKSLKLYYKERLLKKEYTPDLLCFGKLIIDLKVMDRLSGKEEAQILNYLKASGLKVGLLINFGSSPKLEWRRYVR